MNKKWSKKASLNLSIEAIVIIVIAFTVLGLGLTFVKSMIIDAQSTTTEVQANMKEKILNDMRIANQKLSVPGQVLLERGDESIQGIGIVNTQTKTMKYGLKIVPIKKLTPEGEAETNFEEIGKEIIFFYNDLINQKLSPTDSNVIKVTISASNQAAGSYLYNAIILSEITSGGCDQGEEMEGQCSIYDSQSFFVKIS